MNSPKEEAEEVMNALVPLAKKLLEQHGEFYPIGAAMLPNGKVELVARHDGDEHPPSQKVIDGLLEVFRAAAKHGKYKATGIAFDIRTVPPAATEKTDAIAVRLDHISGYSVQVTLPYQLGRDHAVVFGQAFATRGPADVFPSRPKVGE